MNRWHENGYVKRATRALVLACGLLAALPGPAAAQTGVFQRVRIGGCLYSSGSADPEGSLVGNPCDVYTRTTGGTDTTVYRKETGTGNTGWKATTTGAPAAATYITQTTHAGLSAEQALGALASSLLVNTTTTGVLSAYAGTSCTNQFVRSLSALGVSTCASVSLTADVSGDLPFSSLAQGAALSVLGVTGNATADVASIAAASDHQVLRRSGTAVAFGAVNLAQAAAVTGALAVANGGSGIAIEPRVKVHDSASTQSVATSTWVSVAFDSEGDGFDTDTMHSTVTNNSRLTATTAGMYIAQCVVAWDSNVTGTRKVRLFANGTTGVPGAYDSRVAGTGKEHPVVGQVLLTAGQYLECQVWQDSGTTRAIERSGTEFPLFGMVRVGG